MLCLLWLLSIVFVLTLIDESFLLHGLKLKCSCSCIVFEGRIIVIITIKIKIELLIKKGEMASSQVEIASSSSSSAFGHQRHVLRDRNRRCSDSNTFQKNFKELVHHTHGHDYADLWVHKPQWDNNNENNPTHKDIVFTNKTMQRETCTTSNVVEAPNQGGVSTLVRRWRDFETVSNNSPTHQRGEEISSPVFEMSLNLESDKTVARHSEMKEREKLRVADIIRKLAEEKHESDHNGNSNNGLASAESLPRIKLSPDHSERSFLPVLNSPRIIRGRQALSDLLLQMERDRQRELQALKERSAVSKFSHRGRIQALLKVRFLRRGTNSREDRSTNATSAKTNRMPDSAIMHIRKKFNTVSQNGVLSREEADSTHESKKSTLTQLRVQTSNREENKGSISCPREPADDGMTVKVGSELASSQMKPGVDESRALDLGFASSSTEAQEPRETTAQPKVEENTSQVGKVITSNQQREDHRLEEVVNEKISPRRASADVEITSSPNTLKESPFQARHSDISCSFNLNEADRSPQAVKPSLIRVNSQLQRSSISHDQAGRGNASSEGHESSIEFVPRTPKDFEQSIRREEHDANSLQHAGGSNDWCSESTKPQSDWEEEATNQNLVDSDCGWVSDYSHTPSGWDELQSNYQQQLESNQDWLTDISRPRKEWEGLRQARYQEMLDPFIDNHDIRQLLHRKSVSIFLNSGLRDKIDLLMASRSPQHPNKMRKDEAPAHLSKEEIKEEKLITNDETRGGDAKVDEEEDSGYEDDFEDDITPIRQQFLEPDELVDQNKASETFQSWSNNQDSGVSSDSLHFQTSSLPQSQSSISCCHQNKQCSSSTNHPSNEMELIYELRGHMEQLHQEIFEIRRSIKSCVNMQVKLQHSIKQEVAAAISQSGPLVGSNSSANKGASIAKCSICYEEQVDALLYRCGHMCTCFRCAHELLWGTGKCPICESPIIDVVRAYIHS